MSAIPLSETDAAIVKAWSGVGIYPALVPAEFCRKLERERNAAQWCHEKCFEDRKRIIKQRDNLAEALKAADECLALVEDTAHGFSGDAVTVTRSVVSLALATLDKTEP